MANNRLYLVCSDCLPTRKSWEKAFVLGAQMQSVIPGAAMIGKTMLDGYYTGYDHEKRLNEFYDNHQHDNGQDRVENYRLEYEVEQA